MQDEEEYHNDYDDDEIDLVPMPPDRSIWWDYGVILVAGLGCGAFTQWVLGSIAAQFGIGDMGEWAAALTPTTAVQYAHAIRSLSAISSVGSFLLPTLFFIHFFYDLWGFEYLNADRLPRFANFNSSIIWGICAMPMIQGSFALNAWLAKTMNMPQNEVANSFQSALLHTNDYKVLIINLLVMAVLPALCEEFWFRGVIQKVLGRSMRSANTGIWLAAMLFSMLHGQSDGFLPRLLLGAMLGYLAYWSSSIWTSVFAHALFNGSQVVIAFFHPETLANIGKNAAETPLNMFVVIGSLVFTLLFGFFLYFINSHNRGEYEERLVLNV